MQKSESLFARANVVAPGGVHSPVRSFKSVGGSPIFFKSARGAELTSVEGKTYIDFCQSFGPLLLGHRDPEVSGVVHEMIDTAWSFGACEPYSLELAEWIVEKVPHVEKVRFVSSGTEAVMSALRVARAATGRSKILKFEGCYHGHADSLLVKAGSGLAGDSAADSAGVSPQVAAETVVAPLDDEQKFLDIFKKSKKDLAAIILEPLPANYGLLLQRREFLQYVCAEAKAANVLVIFDEVISGFRVALGGMAEVLGISPDLVTYGKIIGGGFPVGAYGGRRDLLDLVAPNGPVYQAGTLSGNPVGMRAGLATLRKVVRENVYDQLENRTLKWATQASEILRPLDLTMTHFSSLFWIHQRTNGVIRRLDQIPTGHGEKFKKFFHSCLAQGVYFAPSGYEVGFLSLAHETAVLDRALKSLQKVVEDQT